MPFSGYAEVVVSRAYRTPDGVSVSPFSSYIPAGSVLEERGFDISWTGDGTVGRCKAPFETREEAEDYARKWNAERLESYARSGMIPPPLPAGALV